MRIPTRCIVIVAALAIPVLSTTGCESNSTEPDAPPGGGSPVLEPNPDGVLLSGDGAASARDALTPLPPSAVDAADIQDGLVTTRLDAWIASGATVADVNAALEAEGARLVTMSDTSPFVTLKIPPVADVAAAQAVADALRDTGAFAYVAPAYVAGASEPRRVPAARAGAADPLFHLNYARVRNAWLVRELARTNDEDIRVLVPDEYASTIPHAEIDAQAFTGFGSPIPLPGPDIYPGNNGFVVSGIIGANVDLTPPTGTNPFPDDLLDIRSMALGGLTWNDVFWSLAYQLASAGNRFVLNTGVGYNDPSYVTYSRLDRAMHVIAWRVASATHASKFVHVTSAGSDEGDVELNSPFVAAARFADVRDMVELETLDTADSLSIETAWSDLQANFPSATSAAANVLVVGAADGTGSPMTGLAPGDVYAIGQNVVGPCVSADPAGGVLCDGAVAAYSGTNVAAAQVSGLAAYLMNLSAASPASVRSILQDAYTSSLTGVVDAFDAVLRLDGGPDGDVRRALLDIAGFESDESDGDFDEYDLPDLVPLAPRNGGGGADPSNLLRRDLNGDGVQGGPGTARFDLDGNGTYGTVSTPSDVGTLEFDENAVTDIDVVVYYAYSDLYNGDQSARAELLLPLLSGVFVEVTGLPERAEVGVPYTITVTAGFTNARGSAEGVEISLELDGGSAAQSGGTTGPDGTFETDVMLDAYANELVVLAWAEFASGPEISDVQSALRVNEVTIESRNMWVGGETFAVYATEQGTPSVTFIEETDFETLVDFATVDDTYGTTGSGTVSGMQASGSSAVDVLCNLDLATGDRFFGVSVDASCDADITLTNPNPGFSHYQASSDSWVEVSVAFYVWGEPAQFNMHGTVSGEYYDIELDGDDDIFVCDSSDEPCVTISTGGELPPGDYDLDMEIYSQGYVSINGPATQGTQSGDATMDINFEINHNGRYGQDLSGRAMSPERRRLP